MLSYLANRTKQKLLKRLLLLHKNSSSAKGPMRRKLKKKNTLNKVVPTN